jgi:hypothetical protein
MRTVSSISFFSSFLIFALASCGQAGPEVADKLVRSEALVALYEVPSSQPDPSPMPKKLSADERVDLLNAIAGAELFGEVMRTKERTGRVVAVGQERNLAKAEKDLEKIKENLAVLSKGGISTYALIHSLKNDNILQSWLIAPDGGIVSGHSGGRYDGLGKMATGLGVRALAATRGPRPEGQPPASPDVERAARKRDQSPEAVEKRKVTLAETATVLLPGEIGEALGTRSGRLLVITARDTGTAPYAALPLKNGFAAKNWSFIVLPDVGTLTEASSFFDFGALDIDNAIIVGDPDLSNDPKFDWSPLPGARREAQAVRKQLSDPSTRLLIGASATRKNFVAAIKKNPDAGIIYMATHAVADPDNPLTQGFMAMSGGHYYAGHIRQERFDGWDHHHPLVIMSACQTALGRYLDGGGFGVARTWTSIGAGQVVASLWNVSDNATSILMSDFVAGLKKGLAPEIAMQKAQIETMNHKDKHGRQPYLDDPKMWASFTVYGKPTLKTSPVS